MIVSKARRVTAGAMIVFMALVLPAAPGFADTVVTEIKAATPGAMAEPAGPPQPKVTKDEAMAKLKQYFPVPQESATVTLDANLSSRGTHTVWDFMITVRQGNSSMGTSLASVDAMTGQILNYSGINFIGSPIRIGPAGPARSEAEAQDKAWKLISELFPDLAPSLKLSPPDQNSKYAYYYYGPGYGLPDAYTFTWTMEVDGIPFPYGSISVSVDKETLAFTGMSANLPEGISIPPGPAKVDAKTAMAAWTMAGDPVLNYVPVMPKNMYGPFTPTAFNLVYQFRSAGQAVDALTGKLITEPMGNIQSTASPEPVPAGDVKPVLPSVTPLTDEEAYKLALELFGVTDTSTIHPEGSGGYDEDVLQFWISDPKLGGSVSFSRTTGMIRYANMSNRTPMPAMPMQGGSDKVSPEQEAQAKAAAIAVVQKYFSPYREELRMAPYSDPYWSRDNSVRRFSFQRYVNGVPVSTDSVYVSIDLNTMTWQDISCSWTTGVTFPDVKGVISPAEAMLKFYADQQPKLLYQPVYPPMVPGAYEPVPPKEARLVYVLEIRPDATMVNALTGELTGYDGQPAAAVADAMKRVQGHWAEGALRYMLTRQALDVGTLNPDGPITRLQAVQMLLQREPAPFGRDMRPLTLPYTDVKKSDPAYNSVLAAYREGWLTPGDNLFRPAESVTRAQFAVWAARALGLGDLARSPLSVVLAYGDLKGLSGEEVNAIHFLRSLGIVGAGDQFRPNDRLTQAEAAAITARIYNYLLGKQVQ